MAVYEADSSASAVLLFDYGEVEFSASMEMILKRHMRIKIINEAGFNWADIRLPFLKDPENSDERSKIDDLKAQTFNLVNDKVEKTEVKKGDIFEESIDGEWSRKVFTFPALKTGSIIELKYRYVSKSLQGINEWAFQHEIPCRVSDFRFRLPDIFKYVQVYQGYESFDSRNIERYSGQSFFFKQEVVKSFQTMGISGAGGSGGSYQAYQNAANLGRIVTGGTEYHWRINDVPAMTPEPYMTTLDNYRAKMRFQLSAITPEGTSPILILKDWNALANSLLEHNDFGGQVDRHKMFKNEAERLTGQLQDPEEKTKTIYAAFQKRFSWNGKYEVFPDRSLDQAFASGQGNSSEINLAMLATLRAAGLNAHPLITSTRKHGKIQKLYPIVSQFNHTLVYVQLENQALVLDASAKLLPYDLLSPDVVDSEGFIVRKDAGWIPLKGKKNYRHATMQELAVRADGGIEGKLTVSDRDYSALVLRRSLDEVSAESYIAEQLFDSGLEVSVDSVSISGLEEWEKPVRIESRFSISEGAQLNGDLIYLNPFIINRISENPFALPNRQYPVEFPFPRQFSSNIKLIVPEGYAVDGLPKKAAVALPGNEAVFRMNVAAQGNAIMINSNFSISQTQFEAEKYEALRRFFEVIIASHSSMVVLKKI